MIGAWASTRSRSAIRATILQRCAPKPRSRSSITRTTLVGINWRTGAGSRWIALERRWPGRAAGLRPDRRRRARKRIAASGGQGRNRRQGEVRIPRQYRRRIPHAAERHLGMAELLGKSPLDTRQRAFIEIIQKSGQALMAIINDIIEFSKLDSGHIQLKYAAFNPAEALDEWRRSSPAAPPRRISNSSSSARRIAGQGHGRRRALPASAHQSHFERHPVHRERLRARLVQGDARQRRQCHPAGARRRHRRRHPAGQARHHLRQVLADRPVDFPKRRLRPRPRHRPASGADPGAG